MRAATEKRWGIDVNGQPTKDLVVTAKHWPEAGHQGDEFTHIWTGRLWGEGEVVRDPSPNLTIGQRFWADVSRLTDSTGTRRIRSMTEHVALGVQVGVRISMEAKGSPLFDKPAIWEALGLAYDALGHPKFAMTLSDIGSPVKRAQAAKAAGWQIAVLPRGTKPTDPKWAIFDAVWGDKWGPRPVTF